MCLFDISIITITFKHSVGTYLLQTENLWWPEYLWACIGNKSSLTSFRFNCTIFLLYSSVNNLRVFLSIYTDNFYSFKLKFTIYNLAISGEIC